MTEDERITPAVARVRLRDAARNRDRTPVRRLGIDLELLGYADPILQSVINRMAGTEHTYDSRLRMQPNPLEPFLNRVRRRNR